MFGTSLRERALAMVAKTTENNTPASDPALAALVAEIEKPLTPEEVKDIVEQIPEDRLWHGVHGVGYNSMAPIRALDARRSAAAWTAYWNAQKGCEESDFAQAQEAADAAIDRIEAAFKLAVEAERAPLSVWKALVDKRERVERIWRDARTEFVSNGTRQVDAAISAKLLDRSARARAASLAAVLAEGGRVAVPLRPALNRKLVIGNRFEARFVVDKDIDRKVRSVKVTLRLLTTDRRSQVEFAGKGTTAAGAWAAAVNAAAEAVKLA